MQHNFPSYAAIATIQSGKFSSFSVLLHFIEGSETTSLPDLWNLRNQTT